MIAAIAALPIGVTLASVFLPAGDAWEHIVDHVLARVLVNTLFLVCAVGVATTILGVSLAWLTAVCEFPGRRLFSWLLLLPLAVPGYVLAVALGGFFEFQGPLRQFLATLGLSVTSWPSPGGGTASALCLSLTLYPYVYLLTRQAFVTQGLTGFEVAQSLGFSPWRSFFKVSIPLARPWIVGGVTLVLMETLADFGTVKVFNFDTLTTAIYSAWYGLFSLTAALQLAAVLIVLVVLALVLERRVRGSARYAVRGDAPKRSRILLDRRRAWLASGYCTTVLAIAFVLPATLMVVWSLRYIGTDLDARYLEFVFNSVGLGLAAAFVVTLFATLLGVAGRASNHAVMTTLQRIATLGYALPGTVLAVGFFAPVAGLSNLINSMGSRLFDSAFRVALTGTILTLLLAYCARFMAVAFQPIDSGLHKVTPNIEDAARGMGYDGFRLFGAIHVPMLRPALATAVLLVFVDVMKELPITLMTRPFGWDTLAVRVFQMTTEGEWERAALPALTIVLAGLLPIYLINRRSQHGA